jgi:serine/threonine protein kinase
VSRLEVHYSLHHPHVIKLLDVFLSDEGPHTFLNLVLELADGHLFHHVNEQFQVPANQGRLAGLPEGDAR